MWGVVPRVASRLTWVSVVALLLASTWLFEHPVPATPKQSASESARETLFETTQPPATHEEVLASLMEKD